MKAALTFALISAGVVNACECSDPTVQGAKQRAAVVFRGTLIALHPTNKRIGFERPGATPKMAVFRVDRVWKGDVASTFEMPAIPEAGGCWGFAPDFIRVGAELLVYAFRSEGEYFTCVCCRTRFVKYAATDFKELGPGEEPKLSRPLSTKSK
jgi:hypothetical protein